MAYFDYDEVNKKLYESGLGNISSYDPVMVSKHYAEAGVDISRYDPMDLVRANEDYFDYASRAESAERDREYDRQEREREMEYERERAERERLEAELEEEEEERHRELQDERELAYIRGEYVGDYSDEEKEYMEILYDYPEELYAYLRSKGAYPDEINSEGVTVSQSYKFPDLDVCNYDSVKKKYIYGWVCDVEPRLEYDLKYFNFAEWDEYISQVQEMRARVAEYEWLKSYEKKDTKIEEVETYARHSFQNLQQRVENFKNTGIVNDKSEKMLNYKIARSLAFDNDPTTIVDRIGQVIKSVLK
ncbi:MAG: hypothetical protein MJ246_05585 [Clostridia bacterium]|nr:hypothetical protein [Clostridia bacterium]